MINWLKKTRCCLSPTEEHGPNISHDNISKFKVTSKTSGVLSGVLEINDEELVHYQVRSDSIKWPFGCLRRHGGGADTFLFESGRRCSTGAGLFVFKCEKADMLREVFTNKLNKFNKSREKQKGSNDRSLADLSTSPRNRHPDDVASNLTPTHVVEEPYLTPLPLPLPPKPLARRPLAPKPLARKSLAPKPRPRQSTKGYINGLMLNQDSQPYINWSPLPPVTNTYVNVLSNTRQGNTPNEGSSSSGYVNGHVVSKINYAELDLTESNSIDHQMSRKSQATSSSTADMQYVNIQRNSVSDSDDDVFSSPLPLSVNRDLFANHGGSPSFDYVIMQPSDNGKAASAPHITQYTIIDVKKTSALSSVTSRVLSESSPEGSRKTRHDSLLDSPN